MEIFFRDQTVHDILPEDVRLDIFFEDKHLLVVNKPSGMVTHPAHGHFAGTLVNALMGYFGKTENGKRKTVTRSRIAVSHSKAIGGNQNSIRPGIVHRLDKGTSGLLVVAKDETVHRMLTEQFSARTVEREYIAIAWGRFKKSAGEIDAPLARHPGDRKRFAVVRRGGKEAITTYRVLETYRDTTLLSLKLKTGRTHQIRAHMEHDGHSLFGDGTYGGRHKRLGVLSGARRKFYEELLEDMPDAALHARVLGFVHPVTKESIRLDCEPPSNFGKVLKLLREDAEKSLDIV